MTNPTDIQLRILDTLAMGRGRHAAMAYISLSRPDTVRVFRAGRECTAFGLADLDACAAAGWVDFDRRMRRYRITKAGRAKRREER